MTPLRGQTSFLDEPPSFGGSTYNPALDAERLSTALGKVYTLMSDSKWRTLAEIASAVGCSEAGASARLRDMRKDRFKMMYPNKAVHSQRAAGGLWVYRLEV